MKRWEAALATAGFIGLLLGAHWIRRVELPTHYLSVEENGCHTPISVIDPPRGVEPAGTAVILHGLAANQRIMWYLGEDFAGHGIKTYLLDLPGHGENTDAFSFARAQECADATVESLTRHGEIDLKRTILVGHSMGAAIAIRMADRDPVAATIAISPAPMNLPQRMPANLLVFSASQDMGTLKKQAQRLEQAAMGDRAAPEDFAQQRAFDLHHVPFSTHTSLVFSRIVAHQSEQWAMQALFPNIARQTVSLNLDLATYETFKSGRRRLAGAVIGLVGILLMFPLGAMLAAKIAGEASDEAGMPRISARHALVEGAACAMVGVLVLTMFTPLKFLHLYTGDYLASLLFIFGALLLALNWKPARQAWSSNVRAGLAAAVLGFAVILGVGAWLNWQITDAWLNAARWWRFAALLPFMSIFCYAEELLLGPVEAGKRRAGRFALALGLRLELFLACTIAYYEFMSGQVLIVLLFLFLAVFSVMQRLGTDAIRRRTGSLPAAAFFGAILAAWFLAAVFPVT